MDGSSAGRDGGGGFSWQDIGTRVDAELRIPDIHGERCVHAVMEQASCRACVEACPRAAWLLDDDGLNLDTDACDGCGLCAPACRQGALQQERKVLHGHWNGRHVAAIACERSGAEAGAGMLPCLHTLGERELLRLQRSGVTHLISSSGDCDRCTRGKATPLAAHLNRVNAWLAPRRRGTLTHVTTDSAHWQHLANSLSDAEGEGPCLSRRAFFRAGLETGARVLGLDQDERQRFQAPGELLDGQMDGLPMPYVPVIDPERCNACHACARLCPQRAIELLEDEIGDAYRLESTLCTGCGICSDSCDRDAIRVDAGVRVATDRLPLYRDCCQSCGVAFLHTEAAEGGKPLCRICSHTAHHRQLFQVY